MDYSYHFVVGQLIINEIKKKKLPHKSNISGFQESKNMLNRCAGQMCLKKHSQAWKILLAGGHGNSVDIQLFYEN